MLRFTPSCAARVRIGGRAAPVASSPTLTRSRTLPAICSAVWPLIRVNIVKLNILGIAFLLWLFPMSVFLAHQAWWIAIAWAIPGLLPLLSGYLWLSLVSIVLILEKRTIWDSLRRSGRLMFKMSEQGFTRTNAFRISILLLVIFAVKTVILWVSQAPFALWNRFQQIAAA